MKKYRCSVCELVYDPEIGDSEGGVPPGIDFETLPDRFSWVCPVCGEGREMFEPIDDE